MTLSAANTKMELWNKASPDRDMIATTLNSAESRAQKTTRVLRTKRLKDDFIEDPTQMMPNLHISSAQAPSMAAM